MYHVDGAFGQVRMAKQSGAEPDKGLFCLNVVGWHKCNDRYHIERQMGIGQHLILVTVAGCGLLRMGAQIHRLQPGTVALIPRWAANSYRVPEGGKWEFYWLHPSGEVSGRFLDYTADGGACVASADPAARYEKRMEELMALCSAGSHADNLSVSQKLSELFHLLAKDLQGNPETEALSDCVQRYIQTHYMEPVLLDQLAELLFVSAAHLIRQFKKQTGMTPHRYLTQCRLEASTVFLRFSDLRVEEIAERVGFSSSSHFISSFRKHYGCTPVQYKNTSL